MNVLLRNLSVYLWKLDLNRLKKQKEKKMNNKQETIVGSAIQKFIEKSLGERIDKDFIYNEFSLQHELGIFLRKELEPFGFKVQFERNIENFFQIPANLSGKERTDWIKVEQKKFCKHEMDILIFKNFDLDSEKYAIELKFPRNGQYPEQMYSFIKDIKFMEQVNEKFNIKTLVDDKNYYIKTGHEKDKSIYWYFRSENDTEKSETITAKQDIEKNTTIQKPTGNKAKNDNESDEKWLEIKLDNSYKKVEWKSILNSDLKNYRYYFFEIPPKKK